MDYTIEEMIAHMNAYWEWFKEQFPEAAYFMPQEEDDDA